MPLTPLPDQGIEVPLSEYNRLRAFQGGGWFWDHDNQQVIREVLGDFLPRVEERRDRGGALFQHFIGGVEAASKSQAVGAQMNRVPKKEFNRLQRALENLKRKSQDPHTDPNARRIIEKFCLPDPSKDPDLYRMYGSSWNRRLLVLWGCEREEGTSLAPTAALNKIAVEPAAAAFLRRLPWLLGLLLLLLLLLLAGEWWWRQHEAQQDRTTPAATTPAPTATDSGNGTEPRTSQANAEIVPPVVLGTTDGTPSPSKPQAPGPSQLEPPAVNRYLPSSTPTAAPDDVTNRSLSDADAHSSSLAQPAKSPISTEEKTASETIRNQSSQTRKQAASPEPERTAIDSSSTAAKTENALSASRQIAASTPPHNDTTAQQYKSASTPLNTAQAADHTIIGTPPGNAAPLPGASPNNTTPGVPPKLEILKAQNSSTPHDGKMDTVLMAAAHESDGSATPIEITRWSVDDSSQQDRAGRNITTGQLNLSLTPGIHRVSVTGTAHGVAVEAETEVDVQIKSQGDVIVKPKAAK